MSAAHSSKDLAKLFILFHFFPFFPLLILFLFSFNCRLFCANQDEQNLIASRAKKKKKYSRQRRETVWSLRITTYRVNYTHIVLRLPYSYIKIANLLFLFKTKYLNYCRLSLHQLRLNANHKETILASSWNIFSFYTFIMRFTIFNCCRFLSAAMAHGTVGIYPKEWGRLSQSRRRTEAA